MRIALVLLMTMVACQDASFNSEVKVKESTVKEDELIQTKVSVTKEEEAYRNQVILIEMADDFNWDLAKITQQPEYGEISILKDQKRIRYVTATGVGKSDMIEIVDSEHGSDAAVSLLVKVLNHAPVADAINQSIINNGSSDIQLSGKDEDGDKISFVLPEEFPEGVLSWDLSEDGKVNLQLDPSFVGTVRFDYKVTDGFSESSGAAVELQIEEPEVEVPENQAPRLNKASLERHILVGQTLSIKFSTLGFDPDGDQLTFIQDSLDKGLVSIDSDAKAIVYQADAIYVGVATLKYKLSDGKANSAQGTIRFVICKNATKMGIYTDNFGGVPDGSIDNEEFKGYILAYQDKSRSASQTYNHTQHSANLPDSLGISLESRQSNVFLVENLNGLNLYIIHNVHNQGGEENSVEWEITVRGNKVRDRVLVSDDPRQGDPELKEVSETSWSKTYRGQWTYYSRTDGGVIGPFKESEVFVAVQYLMNGDLANISFYSSDKDIINLTNDSFIISTSVPDGKICQQ